MHNHHHHDLWLSEVWFWSWWWWWWWCLNSDHFLWALMRSEMMSGILKERKCS